ncbi:MAG TPA: hypothetical protein VGQ59_10105, partial [Cyclobacteriaceae bacterium]|nr:hypothetical protein [Cyclobacteriaceae bacterium]
MDENNRIAYNTDITALTPTIVNTGKDISPASGTAQNFTTPINYTVTATDGTTQVYTASVEVLPINITAINWKTASSLLATTITYSLASSGKNIFFDNHDGLYVSKDYGSTWNKTSG